MLWVKGDELGMVERIKRVSDAEIERIVKTYSAMLYKICFLMLCSESDAEDAVQNTILKYLTKSPVFHDSEHEKAWLIRVAVNTSKDICKSRKRHFHLGIEEVQDIAVSEEQGDILKEILALPQNYKSVLYLFYLGGYQTKEIADILGIRPATVRKRLEYGRKLLRLTYGEEN